MNSNATNGWNCVRTLTTVNSPSANIHVPAVTRPVASLSLPLDKRPGPGSIRSSAGCHGCETIPASSSARPGEALDWPGRLRQDLPSLSNQQHGLEPVQERAQSARLERNLGVLYHVRTAPNCTDEAETLLLYVSYFSHRRIP